MLESDSSDRFDSTTEKRVPLFHLIERDVQLRDNRIGFISDNHQFNIDLLCEHLKTGQSGIPPSTRISWISSF